MRYVRDTAVVTAVEQSHLEVFHFFRVRNHKTNHIQAAKITVF